MSVGPAARSWAKYGHVGLYIGQAYILAGLYIGQACNSSLAKYGHFSNL